MKHLQSPTKKAPTNCSERETKKFGLNGSLFCSFKNPRQVCFVFCAEVLLTFPFFLKCKINIAYWTQKHQLGKSQTMARKFLKVFWRGQPFFRRCIYESWKVPIYLQRKRTQKKKTLLPRLRKNYSEKKLCGQGQLLKFCLS